MLVTHHSFNLSLTPTYSHPQRPGTNLQQAKSIPHSFFISPISLCFFYLPMPAQCKLSDTHFAAFQVGSVSNKHKGLASFHIKPTIKHTPLKHAFTFSAPLEIKPPKLLKNNLIVISIFRISKVHVVVGRLFCLSSFSVYLTLGGLYVLLSIPLFLSVTNRTAFVFYIYCLQHISVWPYIGRRPLFLHISISLTEQGRWDSNPRGIDH